MSDISSNTTIRRIKRGGTEAIKLKADIGDVYQDVIGTDANGKAIVSPDFTAAVNQPTYYPVITVSIKTGTIVPADVKWFYNSQAIVFDEETKKSTGGLANLFQIVTRTSDSMPGLKIIGNLASTINKDNDEIAIDCAIDTGGFSRRLKHSTTILIQERVANVRIGVISYPDGKNGVMTSQIDSCQLKANLRQGNTFIPTSDFKVKWKKLIGESWQKLTNESGIEVTGYTVTITAGIVNSYQSIMAEFYDKSNNFITSDACEVQDASDPLIIVLNPSPANEELVNDTDVIVYSPGVATRENPGVALPGWQFTMTVVSPQGKIIRSVTDSKITVGIPDSDAAGGGNFDVNFFATN